MTDNPYYVMPADTGEMKCPMQMNGTKFPRCHGPSCMAWRWRPAGHQDLMRGLGLPLPLVPEEPMTHGYCGMVRT